jgi:hypothetical protein
MTLTLRVSPNALSRGAALLHPSDLVCYVLAAYTATTLFAHGPF